MSEKASAPDWDRLLPRWCPRPKLERSADLRGVSLDDLRLELAARVVEDRVLETSHDALRGLFDLRDLLEATLLEVHDNRFSPKRFALVLRELYQDLGAWKREFRGCTLVDVGCGTSNPFGLAFLLLLLGAERCYAVDPGEPTWAPRSARALAELACVLLADPDSILSGYPITRREILANASSFDLGLLLRGDVAGIDATRLRYVNASAANLPLEDGEADIVFSLSFFEHASELDAIVAELARVTRPGGLGIHGIDATDHRRYLDPSCHPLEYLKIETTAENFAIDPGGPCGDFMNRIRPHEFAELFERHGFTVLDFREWERTSVNEAMRASFAEPYRSMEVAELELLGGRYLLHKDTGGG